MTSGMCIYQDSSSSRRLRVKMASTAFISFIVQLQEYNDSLNRPRRDLAIYDANLNGDML